MSAPDAPQPGSPPEESVETPQNQLDTNIEPDEQEVTAESLEIEAPPPRPYLQIFGPDTGVFEYYLPYGSVTIGRSDHADIWLPHHTVSRVHATITLDDNEYVLEDANSNFGTTVNNKRVQSQRLRHGDSVQISLYVLQFRTHPALPGASEAAAKARMLLRSKFCLLPSTMRMKYRVLDVAPREIFKPGDTLKIGHGGLLIPTQTSPGEAVCLELHLVWPNDKYKRYLGEIMGVVPQAAADWLCVKLHTVPKEIHETVVAASSSSDWIDVPAT